MMMQESLLLAIKQSKISKIAVIDDAFDVPEIDDDNAGGLLDYLNATGMTAIAAEADASASDVAGAIDALEKTEYSEEALLRVLNKLYSKFGDSFDPKFNPAGLFENQVANLRHLEPVLKLLNQCDPRPIVIRYGSAADEFDAEDVELIFVDFYLDASVSVDSAQKDKTAARRKSLDSVTKLVRSQGEKAPSVILMSSASGVRSLAEKFREDILTDGDKQKGSVFASRFGFLEKTRLKVLTSGKVQAEQDAADDLLDVFQSYQFGRSMHSALERWLSSVEKSPSIMRKEIERLHLKDFAYLVRFRLLEEGQGLTDYLEWFFGECLLDAVGKDLDASIPSQEEVAALDKEGATQIEGAYEGPTKSVADLYHRVRIETPRKGVPRTHRLGDLYKSGSKTVLATLTPDCDLIVRENGKRGAERLLMVTGDLKEFNAPDTTVSDFIMIDGKPHNIVWRAKKIVTMEFSRVPKKEGLKYVGTLRPLYAQELQRRVLHDLGRVGVSTAPAIGVNAAVTVHIAGKGGTKKQIELGATIAAGCTIVPARGAESKAKVMFTRAFATGLLEVLAALHDEDVSPEGVKALKALRKPDASKRLEKLFRQGVECEETIDTGILLTAKSKLKGDGIWCWVRIEMLDELKVETLVAN